MTDKRRRPRQARPAPSRRWPCRSRPSAPIDGVELAVARAGFYKHERDRPAADALRRGTSAAPASSPATAVGSAPVDWCKAALEATGGEGVRALVVNAGCANSFTGGRAPAPCAHRGRGGPPSCDCAEREVMMASTGVIGVLLDDAKILNVLPESIDGWTPDGWAEAAAGDHDHRHLPQGRGAREPRSTASPVQDRRHRQGLGHDRAGHGHHAGLRRHRRGHRARGAAGPPGRRTPRAPSTR